MRFGDPQVLDNADPYFNSVRIGVIFSHHVLGHADLSRPHEQSIQTGARHRLEVDRRHHARDGASPRVKFHNGAEFSADDVVFTLNFVSNPDNKAVIQGNVNWIARAEKLDSHKCAS